MLFEEPLQDLGHSWAVAVVAAYAVEQSLAAVLDAEVPVVELVADHIVDKLEDHKRHGVVAVLQLEALHWRSGRSVAVASGGCIH